MTIEIYRRFLIVCLFRFEICDDIKDIAVIGIAGAVRERIQRKLKEILYGCHDRSSQQPRRIVMLISLQ